MDINTNKVNFLHWRLAMKENSIHKPAAQPKIIFIIFIGPVPGKFLPTCIFSRLAGTLLYQLDIIGLI